MQCYYLPTWEKRIVKIKVEEITLRLAISLVAQAGYGNNECKINKKTSVDETYSNNGCFDLARTIGNTSRQAVYGRTAMSFESTCRRKKG